MTIHATLTEGLAEVVIDRPPVNALDVEGWFALADTITRLGREPECRALILAAEGRGFQAGVDLKELQAAPDHRALVAVNRGCHAAFEAVYRCAVPVIAAVHGYCLGGGIGLVGNADVVIASDDATFALPEVERGALGAATHLARLVPPLRMRAMVYTGAKATAQELHAWGTVLEVVPRAELREAARSVGRLIASRRPNVVRLAKESLVGIDPVDVGRSYRFEQGFTFELNLLGDGDAARADFLKKEDR